MKRSRNAEDGGATSAAACQRTCHGKSAPICPKQEACLPAAVRGNISAKIFRRCWKSSPLRFKVIRQGFFAPKMACACFVSGSCRRKAPAGRSHAGGAGRDFLRTAAVSNMATTCRCTVSRRSYARGRSRVDRSPLADCVSRNEPACSNR